MMRLISGILLACCLVLPLGGFGAAAAETDAYLLGPMDVLRLRVSEWRTETETFRDWSSVSGDYTVNPSGNIAIPFVGEIPADGRTTKDLALLVSGELQKRFGLPDRPDAVFEVDTFRPIYVFGDVQTPGAIPYAPGLSVVKAVATAGGLRRGATQDMRVERDVITAEGDLRVLQLEQHRLLVRRARLQAELDSSDSLTMPEALKTDPEAKALLEDERIVMAADRERLALQVRSLNELKGLLQGEVESLGSRRQAVQRQIDLSRKELADVNSLVTRGLTVNARVSELERRIADFEERVLTIEATALRARQDISKAEQDLIRLENDRRAELAVQRQEVDAQIEALSAKRQSQTGLLQEAQQMMPAAVRTASAGTYTYSIVRKVDGKTVEFSTTETSDVQPSDVVKVKYSLPASAY